MNVYAQDATILIERLIAFTCKRYVMTAPNPQMWTDWTSLRLLHRDNNRHNEFIEAIEAFHNEYLSIGIDEGQTYMRYQLYLWLQERDDLIYLKDRLRMQLIDDTFAGQYIRSRVREDEKRWGIKEFAPVDEVDEETKPELNYVPMIITPDEDA